MVNFLTEGSEHKIVTPSKKYIKNIIIYILLYE